MAEETPTTDQPKTAREVLDGVIQQLRQAGRIDDQVSRHVQLTDDEATAMADALEQVAVHVPATARAQAKAAAPAEEKK